VGVVWLAREQQAAELILHFSDRARQGRLSNVACRRCLGEVESIEPANSALKESWLAGAGQGVTGMEMQEIRYFLAMSRNAIGASSDWQKLPKSGLSTSATSVRPGTS
jgi:hypothetical protein